MDSVTPKPLEFLPILSVCFFYILHFFFSKSRHQISISPHLLLLFQCAHIELWVGDSDELNQIWLPELCHKFFNFGLKLKVLSFAWENSSHDEMLSRISELKHVSLFPMYLNDTQSLRDFNFISHRCENGIIIIAFYFQPISY